MERKSQIGYDCNVCVKVRDKLTNKVISEQKAHNRATKNALYGIIKFIDGQFNPSISDYVNAINHYIPRYVAFGEGIRPVQVTDTSLSSEFEVDNKPYRIHINNSETINSVDNPYMKLIIRTYASQDVFDGYTFTELGLFSSETKQDCWARVLLNEPITKSDTTVIEVIWEVTIISPSSNDDQYRMDYTHKVEGATVEESYSYVLGIQGGYHIEKETTEDERVIDIDVFTGDMNLRKVAYDGTTIDTQTLPITIEDNGEVRIGDIIVFQGGNE